MHCFTQILNHSGINSIKKIFLTPELHAIKYDCNCSFENRCTLLVNL